MTTSVGRPRPGAQFDTFSGAIAATGAVLGIAGLAYLGTHPEPIAAWTVEFALVVLPAAATVYGGYWLAKHGTRDARQRVATWYLTGTIAAGVLFGGYVTAELLASSTVAKPGLLVLLGALGGGFVALFAGISSARTPLVAETVDERPGEAAAGDGARLSADARAFATLAAEPRLWNVVRTVVRAPDPLEVETLAPRLAALEDADSDTIRLELVHSRLPRLVDEGILAADGDAVRPTDRTARIVAASEEVSTAGRSLASSATR
ncbi:hypothetical protein [Natrononativus amylolyticus]|uniref:hypothetical protein n=1 Tax=Natrononativus amylolyticus TaxID=2963434 RepID=UPI0020CBD82D|nr:hypothetical protein [Natrononativus amylolyticus]